MDFSTNVAVKPHGTVRHTLDELGSMPLARFDYRPLIGPTPRPPSLRHEPVAFPTWDAANREEFGRLGWDGFWAAHPVGVSRLVKVDGSSYDVAVQAARQLVSTSKPGSAEGDRQAHAVLQAADGAWYLAGLGEIVRGPFGDGARIQKLGPLPQYERPKITPLVPELKALVGGVSVLDLRSVPVAGNEGAALPS